MTLERKVLGSQSLKAFFVSERCVSSEININSLCFMGLFCILFKVLHMLFKPNRTLHL
jgi:hypothetical protein